MHQLGEGIIQRVCPEVDQMTRKEFPWIRRGIMKYCSKSENRKRQLLLVSIRRVIFVLLVPWVPVKTPTINYPRMPFRTGIKRNTSNAVVNMTVTSQSTSNLLGGQTAASHGIRNAWNPDEPWCCCQIVP
jgi:hypothetical protein